MRKHADVWRNRIVSSGMQAADQFLAHPDNYRRHPHEQEQALIQVLDRVGWVQEVLVSQRTGYLLDGHLRVKAALARGDETPVPYKVVDVTEDEEALLLAAYDPIGALARADYEKLNEVIGHLSAEDVALARILHGDRIVAEPPASFRAVDEDLPTAFRCPKCGYEWSGQSKPAAGYGDENA